MPGRFIETLDDPILFERLESFRGGMDAFQKATVLPPDTNALLQNLLIEENHTARSRAGTAHLGDSIGTAQIRGLGYLDTPSTEQLLAVIDGTLQSYNGTAWSAVQYGGNDWPGTATYECAFAQGVNNLLMVDGNGNGFEYDGTTLSDCGSDNSTAGGDPPIGATLLCWHEGRMFASGVAAESDTIWVGDALPSSFSGTWNHDGSMEFRVGKGEGSEVRGMISLFGSLIVLKGDSVWHVDTSTANPSSYTAADYTITPITRGAGAVGKRAWAATPQGLMFFAYDGVRLVHRMEGDGARLTVDPPISEPLRPWIQRLTDGSTDTITAWSYRNLTLFAVPLDSSTTPNYVFVWNGWTGTWAGVWKLDASVTRMITTWFSDTPTLVFGKSNGKVSEWLDKDSRTATATFLDEAATVDSEFLSKGLLFGDAIQNKDPLAITIRLKKTNTPVYAELVLDGTVADQWNFTPDYETLDMPFDLPVDFPNPGIHVHQHTFNGLDQFNEAQVRLKTFGGPLEIHNITMQALPGILPYG